MPSAYGMLIGLSCTKALYYIMYTPLHLSMYRFSRYISLSHLGMYCKTGYRIIKICHQYLLLLLFLCSMSGYYTSQNFIAIQSPLYATQLGSYSDFDAYCFTWILSFEFQHFILNSLCFFPVLRFFQFNISFDLSLYTWILYFPVRVSLCKIPHNRHFFMNKWNRPIYQTVTQHFK